MPSPHLALRSVTLSVVASLFLSLLAACGSEDYHSDTGGADSTVSGETSGGRIISLGGSVTETVFALGEGEQLIAVDITSTYPEEATQLPQVGYLRTLSAESIIAMNPTIVLASSDAKPSAALAQIASVGIPVITIPEKPTVEGIREKIVAVAVALGVEERGNRLADSIASGLKREENAREEGEPSLLFIYARGSGSLHAAGKETSADVMIALAGGKNAVTQYAGFRPLTSEGMIAANPDILLIPESGLEGLGGVEGLLKSPGVSQTSAGRSGRVVVMDDLYLLGLGPRTANAVTDLRKQIAQAMEKGQ